MPEAGQKQGGPDIHCYGNPPSDAYRKDIIPLNTCSFHGLPWPCPHNSKAFLVNLKSFDRGDVRISHRPHSDYTIAASLRCLKAYSIPSVNGCQRRGSCSVDNENIFKPFDWDAQLAALNAITVPSKLDPLSSVCDPKSII